MASWSLIASSFFCCLAILLEACGAKPLPVYGDVPQFKLTAQTGAEFDSASLRGEVWVADFIFTNCPGPCPRMTSQLKRVGQAVPAAKLVSITIDPARDTPEILRAYAEKFHADATRWKFLTGPQPALQHLSRNVFKLGDVDASLEHSTRFVLVDAQSRIRGFYHSNDPEGIDHLIRDARVLLKKSS